MPRKRFNPASVNRATAKAMIALAERLQSCDEDVAFALCADMETTANEKDKVYQELNEGFRRLFSTMHHIIAIAKKEVHL
jgi:hypothetical protein